MSRRSTAFTDVAAEAAIDRVLAAEREARDLVESATSEAAAIVDAARSAARAITERNERRMRCVRDAFAARAAREIAAIDAEIGAQDASRELSSDDLARLECAVTALCVELTGGRS